MCLNVINYKELKWFTHATENNSCCKKCGPKKRTGIPFSEERKKNISNALKEKIKSGEFIPNMTGAHSLASRKKMSLTRKGKKLSEEHKKKISDGVSNSEKHRMSITPERNKKISDSNKGKKFSDETRKKMKENHTNISGDKNPFYGKTHTAKTKKKLRIAAIKRKNIAIENGFQFLPAYNKKGCLFFNKLMENDNNIKICHAENGGEYHIKELGYWVDGYDKENNVVYEWDEDHHFNSKGELKLKDINREKEIKEFLKCEFIRIRQSDIDNI
jgi:hypothetical protein